jgi:hypothetical protein
VGSRYGEICSKDLKLYPVLINIYRN